MEEVVVVNTTSSTTSSRYSRYFEVVVMEYNKEKRKASDQNRIRLSIRLHDNDDEDESPSKTSFATSKYALPEYFHSIQAIHSITQRSIRFITSVIRK
jgi:hypothetical protein